MTTFTAGAQNTLPIWIFGQIRLGQQLPEVNAIVFRDPAATIDPGRDRPAADARRAAILRTERLTEVDEHGSVTRNKNFVGGEWVDAVEGGTMEVLNPATGETIAEVPRGTQADVDARRRGGEGGAARVARDDARRARRGAAEARRRRSTRTPRSSPQLESRNVGKPLSLRARRDAGVRPTTCASSPGAARHARGQERPASTCAATPR